MTNKILIVGIILLLVNFFVDGQKHNANVVNRSQVLKELRKCVSPRQQSGCDEMSVQHAAELYHRGDTKILSAIMDVAPGSDGALSEGLGSFFSQLLCSQTEKYLQAVRSRPAKEHEHLLFLAAVADGGGMGCQRITHLRQKLKSLARSSEHPLSKIAKRCLSYINKFNS